MFVKHAEPGEVMYFYNFNNQLQKAFCCVCRFKMLFLIINDEPGILQKNEPTSAAFYFVSTFNPKTNQTWSYVGKDCFSKLITDLNKLAQECIEEMHNITQHMKSDENILNL